MSPLYPLSPLTPSECWAVLYSLWKGTKDHWGVRWITARGAPLTKGVQIYSFASFLNFMDGDKAGFGFDRAPLRVQGGADERRKARQRERKTELSFSKRTWWVKIYEAEWPLLFSPSTRKTAAKRQVIFIEINCDWEVMDTEALTPLANYFVKQKSQPQHETFFFFFFEICQFKCLLNQPSKKEKRKILWSAI